MDSFHGPEAGEPDVARRKLWIGAGQNLWIELCRTGFKGCDPDGIEGVVVGPASGEYVGDIGDGEVGGLLADPVASLAVSVKLAQICRRTPEGPRSRSGRTHADDHGFLKVASPASRCGNRSTEGD